VDEKRVEQPVWNFLVGIFFKLARRRRRKSCSSVARHGRITTMAVIYTRQWVRFNGQPNTQ